VKKRFVTESQDTLKRLRHEKEVAQKYFEQANKVASKRITESRIESAVRSQIAPVKAQKIGPRPSGPFVGNIRLEPSVARKAAKDLAEASPEIAEGILTRAREPLIEPKPGEPVVEINPSQAIKTAESFDIGLDQNISPDMLIPISENEFVSARSIMDDLSDDIDLLEAMKVCAL